MENLSIKSINSRKMNFKKIIPVCLSMLLISGVVYSQDRRLMVTKVADLLAQLPATDAQYTSKLMDDMLSLGEEGIKQICNQIIPVGTGDDTRPRFAVESMSRYLSQFGKETEKAMWEKICISYADDQKDYTVKDFFMKQLQLTGSDASVLAMKKYLTDKSICLPALAVISSIGGKQAETVLCDALKDKNLPCASSVMNTLALMKSQKAVNEYIEWCSSNDKIIRGSAYNALAWSGNPLAFSILMKAAKDASYKWEHSEAMASLLIYARVITASGDVKTMDKICKTVMTNCNERNNIQYKASALGILVSYYGYDAMPYLFEAAGHPDKSYRNAAFRFSLSIPGSYVTRKWIDYYPKAISAAKPEIINMFGLRKDELAIPLVVNSLSDPDVNVRKEAATAIVLISGKNAIPPLIDYMTKFTDSEDQESAKSALMTVVDSRRMPLVLPVLKDGPGAAKKSAIELIAWGRGQEYFSVVLPYTSSEDKTVKSAAYKALSQLVGPDDQNKLIDLLNKTDDPALIADVQLALANAANQIADPEKRSAIMVKAVIAGNQKEKIIPVLAKTGGREALATVLKEFDNGAHDMRDICFNTLSSWKDYSASSALYEICASGNKTYEAPAFKGYVRQIRSASLPDDEKLLLYRKIMPYALTAERKNEIITETGKLKTYQSLFFVSEFLSDPETSPAAAKAALVIALPSIETKAGMYGTLVKDILKKAVPQLKGLEIEYDTEMINKYLDAMPADEGFVPMFNGKDLTGWQGLVETPLTRAKMKPAELAKKQAEANKKMLENWSVKDGCIRFSGSGANLCSVREYCDFELLVDWKISKKGDSGIYLRGSPQVQIWDTSRVDAGAQVGSGGLYNNQKNESKPLKVADNPIGDWNTFRILMIGEKASVWLNGVLVVNNVTLENFWDRTIPIFPKGAIELQAHGTDIAFRDIYVREISEKDYNLTPEEKANGFVALFNGRNLDNWVGNKESYVAEDGMIVIKPEKGSGGNLYTEKEYADFIFRFEFLLTPAANNGLGIRAPLTGDAAYVGMELQILDDTAPVYANLQPYQYHGSVYGVIPARTGFLKPLGEWNYEEVSIKGTQIKITLNGTVIVDGDIAYARDNGTIDHNDHPGLKNKTGHIGFLGHGSIVKFRNIRLKDISK
jgi:HEAT repeat protein